MKDYRENYADDYRDDDSDRAFFELIAKLCQRDEEGTFVPVEPRIELVKKLFQVTKLIFQGADAATLTFNTPFHGMEVISLDGRNLCILRRRTDTGAFAGGHSAALADIDFFCLSGYFSFNNDIVVLRYPFKHGVG